MTSAAAGRRFRSGPSSLVPMPTWPRTNKSEVEARREETHGRGGVELLRLRDADQRLELDVARHHPGHRRPDDQVVVAPDLRDGRRRRLFVLDLGLQAAVDAGP